MTAEEVKAYFGGQHIEKGEDREKVAQADVEVSGNTHVAVKEDEKQGQVRDRKSVVEGKRGDLGGGPIIKKKKKNGRKKLERDKARVFSRSKKMTKADVEVSGNTHVAVKEDEKQGQV